MPDDYLRLPPDAVFEVFDRHDRWSDIPGRVAEYLRFGVDSVYVLNPQTSRIHCFYQELPDEILDATEELVGIGILTDWRVPVARFFE